MALRLSICGNRYYFTFKMAGLTLVFVALFSSLGVWQYHRAEQKRALIQAYADRAQQPIAFSSLFEQKDKRYYAIQLKGRFDNHHQILLDNKTHEGRVGYEVYTPLLVEGSSKAILVDRGWVPAQQNRTLLPAIEPVEGLIYIKGVVSPPPAYFSLGSMLEGLVPAFPLRVQYVDLKDLSQILGYSMAPYIVWLDPAAPQGFVREWKVTLMGPEKHIMYTVQWFAFALSLLVIFVVLNCHRVEK